MSTSGAAMAELYEADAKITITGGHADPEEVKVKLLGTVQFVNTDKVAYKVRLWGPLREHHADVDILLPARGGFTLIVDPDTLVAGKCEYELLAADFSEVPSVRSLTSSRAELVAEIPQVTEIEVAAGKGVPKMPPPGGGNPPMGDNKGGGGTIIIGG
jgi:hypothetical protein